MPAGWSTGTKSANHRVTTLTTRAQAKRTVDAEDPVSYTHLTLPTIYSV